MPDRIYRMHVFGSKGNRFVFLNKYSYYLDEKPCTPDYDASLFALCSSGLITYDDEFIDVPEDEDGNLIFENVPGELISRIFMHGGCHCYYISGPLFDSCKKENI